MEKKKDRNGSGGGNEQRKGERRGSGKVERGSRQEDGSVGKWK